MELEEKQESLNNLTQSLLSESVSEISEIEEFNRQIQKKITIKRELEEKAEKQQSQEKQVKAVIDIHDNSFTNQYKYQDKFDLSWLPVIKPKSVIYWKIFMGLLILVLFFITPIYITFGNEFWEDKIPLGGRLAIFYSIELMFIFDMALDFVTAYYKHGNLVTDRRLIAKNYFYGYWIFDSLAIITTTIRLSIPTNDFRFVYLMFYFKLPSLMRIDQQISELILLHKKLRTVYQICCILIFMFFCFNVFACLFYKVGCYAMSQGYKSWLDTETSFGKIDELPIQETYFYAFYFALGTVSTTMGYGDITPMNIYECSFCLVGILFAIMVFALNINSFQRMMEEYHQNDLTIFRQKICINKFMELKQVPEEFRERIRQYLNEYWYIELQRDQDTEQEIFKVLAPELRQDLLYYSHGQFLQQTLFSKHFSKPFLKELSLRIIEVNYSKNEHIIYAKSTPQTDDFGFYFIIQGEVQLTPGNSNEFRQTFTQNQYFGEWSFFTGFPRTAGAQAQVYTQLYKITRQDFLECLEKFPHDYERYCQLRDQLLFSKNFSVVDMKCWTCNSQEHYALECPLTHYDPPIQNLIENPTILDKKQERLFIERYDRKQWPTWLNSGILTKGLSKPKLMRKATQMLQTQKLLLQPKSKNEIKQSPILKRIDSEENIQKQNQNQMMNSIKPIPLEQYKQLQQPSIKKGLDNFDTPANFKNYFSKFNSSNYEAFKGLDNIISDHRFIEVRKTFIKNK